MSTNKLRRILSLSKALANAEFKLRNEGTILGILWYLLNPLLTFLLLLGIFSDRIGNKIPNYALYLLIGIILFNFFQNVTSECANRIRGQAGLIKTINFPRESLIGSIVIKVLYSHIFEIIVMVLFLVYYNYSILNLLLYPLILIPLILFSFGVGLILSSITVYLVDFNNIWGFIVRLIWFATPIFYDIGGQDRLQLLNYFNPMYYFISVAREAIIYLRVPELWMIMGMWIYSIIFLTVGLILFNKLKRRFAELI